VNPFARVASLEPGTIAALVATAARLLRASVNEQTGRIPLSVYRRAGEPCRRCRGAISMRKQGENVRSTYWCAACQPPRA